MPAGRCLASAVPECRTTYVEQKRTFEQTLIPALTDAEAIEHAFESIAREDELEIDAITLREIPE